MRSKHMPAMIPFPPPMQTKGRCLAPGFDPIRRTVHATTHALSLGLAWWPGRLLVNGLMLCPSAAACTAVTFGQLAALLQAGANISDDHSICTVRDEILTCIDASFLQDTGRPARPFLSLTHSSHWEKRTTNRAGAVPHASPTRSRQRAMMWCFQSSNGIGQWQWHPASSSHAL